MRSNFFPEAFLKLSHFWEWKHFMVCATTRIIDIFEYSQLDTPSLSLNFESIQFAFSSLDSMHYHSAIGNRKFFTAEIHFEYFLGNIIISYIIVSELCVF